MWDIVQTRGKDKKKHSANCWLQRLTPELGITRKFIWKEEKRKASHQHLAEKAHHS
jgi:hypothetical protein